MNKGGCVLHRGSEGPETYNGNDGRVLPSQSSPRICLYLQLWFGAFCYRPSFPFPKSLTGCGYNFIGAHQFTVFFVGLFTFIGYSWSSMMFAHTRQNFHYRDSVKFLKGFLYLLSFHSKYEVRGVRVCVHP